MENETKDEPTTSDNESENQWNEKLLNRAIRNLKMLADTGSLFRYSEELYELFNAASEAVKTLNKCAQTLAAVNMLESALKQDPSLNIGPKISINNITFDVKVDKLTCRNKDCPF